MPTLEEVGYRGAVSRPWFGLRAHRHATSHRRKDRKEVTGVLAELAFRERQFTARSLVIGTNVGEAFIAEVKKDRAEAAQVVKDAGLTPQ